MINAVRGDQSLPSSEYYGAQPPSITYREFDEMKHKARAIEQRHRLGDTAQDIIQGMFGNDDYLDMANNKHSRQLPVGMTVHSMDVTQGGPSSKPYSPSQAIMSFRPRLSDDGQSLN